MWRELEDQCSVNHPSERGRLRLQQESSDAMPNCPGGEGRGSLEDIGESENGSVDNLESLMGSMNETEDRQSITSEQSQDFGVVERERVRQVFREWMNSGVTARAPSLPCVNRNTRAQWLGETERERVRIVREWIQMTTQQGESCVRSRDEQVTEIGSQIERVRDGHTLDHNEGQPESSRRENRRLCGRQALLDLLVKNEQERQLELQGLEAARPVTSFAHRNRIQSLLRIRCFQNIRSAELSRSTSAAESELGLLRQRQTVSGLREGFLSRLDNNSHVQASDGSGGPSDNNGDGIRNDQRQVQASNVIEVLARAHEQNDHDGDSNVTSLTDVDQLPGCSAAEFTSKELVAQVEARLDDTLNNGGYNRQETASIRHSNGSSDDGRRMLNSEEPSRGASEESSDPEQSHELFCQQYNAVGEENNNCNPIDDLVGDDVSEDVNGQGSSVQVEESLQQVAEYEERDWEGDVMSNQWRDDDLVETDRQHWLGDGEDLSSDALGNVDSAHNDVQVDYWHENGSQETPRDWLEMPSGLRATSSGRVDTYYFSDDDNESNLELRELLNRRRVSSLLHSGFRESLDQLILSHMERQTHAPDDWELHEMSPPFAAHDQEQLDTDHNQESIAAEGIQPVAPTPLRAPQVHGQQVLHHTNWSSHEIFQQSRTEWETINDLRIDMARLQQRLNNMQRMLETCMDMQLELQRCVRQEVSAALNRSINPSESFDNILPKDGSKWDCVKKGICCICSHSNIDSLLYRCGHMCTCTECANVLLQSIGKCPMCQAPIVEVIRPYFIQ